MSSPVRPRHGILLTLAYDGSRFSGFAPQNNGVTVAGVLRAAILQMDPSAGPLRVASRTDAGVHARAQVACFDCQLDIESRGWLLGLSAFLPPEVAVQRVARVPAGFNPSQEARAKTYHYWILRGTVRDPFLAGRAWRVHDKLDLEAMRAEAQALLGTHDFSAFRGSADRRENAVRTISLAELSELEAAPRCVCFAIRGDRFLYNMVRIIVGTLVDVGRRHCDPGAVLRAYDSKKRTDLGMTAPPDGLYLDRVELQDWGHSEWPNHS
jgi:tRNA pseudouridine38-40 synthase